MEWCPLNSEKSNLGKSYWLHERLKSTFLKWWWGLAKWRKLFQKTLILASEVIVQATTQTHIWNGNFFSRFSSLCMRQLWKLIFRSRNKGIECESQLWLKVNCWLKVICSLAEKTELYTESAFFSRSDLTLWAVQVEATSENNHDFYYHYHQQHCVRRSTPWGDLVWKNVMRLCAIFMSSHTLLLLYSTSFKIGRLKKDNIKHNLPPNELSKGNGC